MSSFSFREEEGAGKLVNDTGCLKVGVFSHLAEEG